MFNNKKKRYITKGIDTSLSPNIQMLCWELIDQLKKEGSIALDYLQIFEITHSNNQLAIIHRQEEPEYLKEHNFVMPTDFESLVVEKVWVIDDGTNQTMLLPEEY